MWKVALAASLVLLACGRDGGVRPSETSTPAPTPTPPPGTAVGDAAAARAAWVRSVQAYVADPETIPRLSDPAGKPRFEQLVAEPAWLTLDGPTFEREGPELLAFFPAAKAFSIALVKLGAGDESVLFKLFMIDVNRAMIGAGIEHMEAQRRVDPDQTGREAGLQRMQLGLAMETCAVLFESASASPPIAQRVLDRFSTADAYAPFSTEGLQLILATIDARMDRKRNAAVRAAVAKVHAERVAAAGPPDRTFEALTMWSPIEARTVVSKGGGFAVTVGSGALVWRSDSPRDGTEHLEWRDGELLFEVYCMPGLGLDATVAGLRSGGATERQGPGPGHWLTPAAAADRAGAMRVVEIAGRVCLAGIEAPKGAATAVPLDEILGSLRPAP